MTFGGGEVAMPAAGESTAEEALTISVDSATTEEDKKPKPSASSSKQRSSSAPRTTSQTRSSFMGTRTRTSDRRPSKTVIQCLQSSRKGKDREPRSPEQLKSRSSSSNASRKASTRQSQSPSLVRRRSTDAAPMPCARDAILSTRSATQQSSRVESYKSTSTPQTHA